MAYNITDSADIGSKGVARIGNTGITGFGSTSRLISGSEMPKQGKQTPILHGDHLDYSGFLSIA